MGKVTSLGHVGIAVRDLEKMTDFYTRVLGLTVTDEIPGRGVFMSGRPDAEHHEVVLGLGEKPSNTQQLSLLVGSMSDLRQLSRAIRAEGCGNIRTLTHGISVSCYFDDPEGNYVECYWPTGLDYPQPFVLDLDLELSDDEIMQVIDDLPAADTTTPHMYGQDTGKRVLAH